MSRVLVVDDDFLIRDFVKTVLEDLHVTVVEASDGVSALDLMRSEPALDLVITDVIMPRTDGLELIRTMRRERPGIKVLAISFGGKLRSQVYLENARGFGADGVLPKPFTSDQLKEEVRRLLH